MASLTQPSDGPPEAELRQPVVQFHLLGQVDFEDCLALQQRLAQEAAGRGGSQATVLVCEHRELITVGRNGSRGHIRLTDEQLRRRRWRVRWVGRGGGCVLHAPGQLAVYPLVPLERCGWSVGQYMGRLQAGVAAALRSLNIPTQTCPGHYAVWGRTGLLAAAGVAVRQGVTRHGVFLNVHPPMNGFAFIDSAPPESLPAGQRSTMSCLLAERQRAVRMPMVRAALIEHLAASLGCQRYHLHTGHPWLRQRAAG